MTHHHSSPTRHSFTTRQPVSHTLSEMSHPHMEYKRICLLQSQHWLDLALPATQSKRSQQNGSDNQVHVPSEPTRTAFKRQWLRASTLASLVWRHSTKGLNPNTLVSNFMVSRFAPSSGNNRVQKQYKQVKFKVKSISNICFNFPLDFGVLLFLCGPLNPQWLI